MFIPDPDFYPSRIQQQEQKKSGKFFCPTIFCSHKYHKSVNNFIFEQVKQSFFYSYTVPFPQKFVIKLSKIWIGDPGSRIQGLKGTGSGFATLLCGIQQQWCCDAGSPQDGSGRQHQADPGWEEAGGERHEGEEPICHILIYTVSSTQCCESVTFWYGSGSCSIRQWLTRCQQKISFFKFFLLITFWGYIYISFHE